MPVLVRHLHHELGELPKRAQLLHLLVHSPALSWHFDLKANDGGIAAGQFVVVTDTSNNPCLVVFTDNLQGTWFLSAPGEAQGGCAE